MGKFNAEATLSEVRRWSLSAWKHPYGLSVYEMGNNYFLFECSSRNQVEQIMEGTWEWKKIPVSLIWWNPLATTIEGSKGIESTWVRIIGLPLHLWSHTTFKSIGDCCGGWQETDEETTLHNHLK